MLTVASFAAKKYEVVGALRVPSLLAATRTRPVPRLSIIIPCLGGAAEFDATLVSVLQNRPTDCEVLVLHTEPYDDPYSLGDEVRFIESHAGSLVELLNIGVEQASGEVLHIVGCGLEATEH